MYAYMVYSSAHVHVTDTLFFFTDTPSVKQPPEV